ncbi:glycoside hydrolase family 10 protein, partial [Anabaena sp. UHCC 0204]|nr:glycoside hydrolase family 10 protein [Anabaena sp. UHCC 0204]
MPPKAKEPKGCGCANIPFSLIIVILGSGYWWFSQKGNLDISKILSQIQQMTIPILNPTPVNSPIPTASTSISATIFPPVNSPIPTASISSTTNISPSPTPVAIKTIAPKKTSLPLNPWEKKVIRGIYLSRYNITNNASEKMIRERVRYYHSQGFNTIIHGVWGNACTM